MDCHPLAYRYEPYKVVPRYRIATLRGMVEDVIDPFDAYTFMLLYGLPRPDRLRLLSRLLGQQPVDNLMRETLAEPDRHEKVFEGSHAQGLRNQLSGCRRIS